MSGWENKVRLGCITKIQGEYEKEREENKVGRERKKIEKQERK